MADSCTKKAYKKGVGNDVGNGVQRGRFAS